MGGWCIVGFNSWFCSMGLCFVVWLGCAGCMLAREVWFGGVLVFGWLVLVVVCVVLLQVIALMLCLFVIAGRFGIWWLMVVCCWIIVAGCCLLVTCCGLIVVLVSCMWFV